MKGLINHFAWLIAILSISTSVLGQTQTAVIPTYQGNKVFLELSLSALQANLDTLFAGSGQASSELSSLTWADILEQGTSPGMDVEFFGYQLTGAGQISTTGTFTGDSLVVNKDASITGRLNVNDVVQMDDSLYVTSTVTFNDSLRVVRSVSIGSRLFVTGVTSLGDSLHVVGNAHLAGDLRVDGDVSLGGALSVSGKTSLNDSLVVSSGVQVNGTMVADSLAVASVISGQVSSLANHTTTNLSEGTNLYFTDARAQDAMSAGTGVSLASGEISIGQAVGTTDDVTFNQLYANSISTTGALSVSGKTSLNDSLVVNSGAQVNGTVLADSLAVAAVISGQVSSLANHTTSNLTEGANLYFTDARAQGAMSAGKGVSLASGEISIGQAVGTTDDVTFNQLYADSISATGTLVVSGKSTLNDSLLVNSGAVVSGTLQADSIISNSTINASAGLKMADGTEGNGYVLTSDASGNAYWNELAAAKSPVFGVMNNSAPTNAIGSVPYCTGSYIDIPPGSWAVNLGFIAKATSTHSGGYWIRTVLSTDCSSYTPPTFIAGGPTMVAGVLTSNSTYGFLSGSVMVKNEGTTDIRMYVWRYWSESVNGADPNNTLESFAKGVWNEDYIYAMPLNN